MIFQYHGRQKGMHWLKVWKGWSGWIWWNVWKLPGKVDNVIIRIAGCSTYNIAQSADATVVNESWPRFMLKSEMNNAHIFKVVPVSFNN